MKTRTTGKLEDVVSEVDELMDQEDLSRSEAIELLLLSEMRQVNDQLRDIEVHTNNTVRQL